MEKWVNQIPFGNFSGDSSFNFKHFNILWRNTLCLLPHVLAILPVNLAEPCLASGIGESATCHIPIVFRQPPWRNAFKKKTSSEISFIRDPFWEIVCKINPIWSICQRCFSKLHFASKVCLQWISKHVLIHQTNAHTKYTCI